MSRGELIKLPGARLRGSGVSDGPKTHGLPRQGLARACGGHIYLACRRRASPMRRAAYILTLIGIWAASMAGLALGLDGLEHPPFLPIALISGAYFGSISAVSLAEEISEWTVQKTAPLR